MLLRKQTSYNEQFRCTMSFNPRKEEYEAGLVLWWSQFSYATIGFKLSSDRLLKSFVTRTPTGQAGELKVCGFSMLTFLLILTVNKVNHIKRSASTPAEDGDIFLQLRCDETSYHLSIEAGEAKWDFTVPAANLTVLPPVGGTFAGVMYGVYSFGKGEPVLDPADFRDIGVWDTD
jgi:hypothetical protein